MLERVQIEILRISEAIWNDQIAQLFFFIIATWFLIAAFLGIFRPAPLNNLTSRILSISPRVLIMLGVFGTFFGILLGFLDFNVKELDKIDNSVLQLLGGLKIAFTTSVVGIAAAIIFLALMTILPRGIEDSDDIPTAIHWTLQKQTDLLADLKEVISQDSDSSLLTQIKNFRSDIRDGQRELINEFSAFKDHMVENNQKALIEALREVIRDFNQNLTEQFGENFKQLNKAATKLVEWQEEYRQYIEALQERLENAVQATEESGRALEAVRGHTREIPNSVQKLQPILTAIDGQIKQLGPMLDSIAALREKALEAFPGIEDNLTQVTNRLAGSCDSVVAATKEVLEKNLASQQELNAGFQTLLENTRRSQNTFKTSIDDTLKRIERESERTLAEHGRLIQSAAIEAQSVLKEAWENSLQEIDRQMRDLNQGFQTLLEKSQRSQETFARNLDNTLQQIEQETNNTLANHALHIQGSARETQKIIKSAWETYTRNMNDQLIKFDEKMHEEMNSAMDIFGSQLASVSEKFVADYSPLTEKLQNLVCVAEEIKSNGGKV